MKRRKTIVVTAKQRTEAARWRCWWRTVGQPCVQAAVWSMVEDCFARLEGRMRASMERMDNQIRFGMDEAAAGTDER